MPLANDTQLPSTQNQCVNKASKKLYIRSVSPPSSDHLGPLNENPSCPIWNFGNKI